MGRFSGGILQTFRKVKVGKPKRSSCSSDTGLRSIVTLSESQRKPRFAGLRSGKTKLNLSKKNVTGS